MLVLRAVVARGREDRNAGKRVQCRRFLLSVLILVVAASGARGVPNLRGIASQDEKYYQSAVIKCKDGSKSFPQERLNDDFCDCVDGTDEPGTNACPEAKFYCRNLGHRPVILFSSRVNDGICDCCDGSDEYDGKIKCPNTCRESGKQSTEKLKKKLGTFKEGLITRKRDVENAHKQEQKHAAELIQLKGEEKVLRDVVSKLKVEKEAVEKAEKEEKEKRDKEEQNRKEKEKAASKEESPQAEEVPSQVEVPPESSPEEKPVEEDTEKTNLEALSEEERGRVIASRWTGEDVSDILSKGEDSEELPVHHNDIEHDVDEDEASYQDPVLVDEEEPVDEDDDYDVPHIPPSDKAERIRREYQDSNTKLQEIESKIADLEKRTTQDFGKDKEFYSFYDNCFEFKEKKYVYKVCPYQDATQVEGHHTTRLGRWQGFKDDYREMIFQNGDKCWNGPERSLRVKMRCGTKLELRGIDEPSRCEYVAEFSTPALCLESKVQALEQQLSNQSLESSHDEL